MSRALLVGLLLLGLGLLAGCDELRAGVVVEKRFEPDSTSIMLMPVMTNKTVILVPYPVHDDADYVVVIEGSREGRTERRTLYLDEATYQGLEVGDRFQVSSGAEEEDPVVQLGGES